MRNILILAALLFATTAYAAPPTDHDGSGTETFTLDYSTMVDELNDSTARYRITDGTTVGDWTSWTVTNGDATDAVLDMPETEEDVTIELEVTDLAGNTNDYAADALVIPYAAGGTLLVGFDTAHTGTTTNIGGNGAYGVNTDMTAEASGNIVKGYAYINSWWALGEGEYIKMLVYSAGDDDELIAVSADVEGASQTVPGWVEFTFSTGTIVESQDYHIGVIVQDFVQFRTESRVSLRSGSGTYASPPASVPGGGGNSDVGPFYLTN